MKKIKITLAAIAVALGFLKSIPANPEHLRERLMQLQVQGEVKPEYSTDQDTTTVILHKDSLPQIIRSYEANGTKIDTYYFPLQIPIIENLKVVGYNLVFPPYPGAYVIEEKGVIEVFRDLPDGLNRNEIFQPTQPVQEELLEEKPKKLTF